MSGLESVIRGTISHLPLHRVYRYMGIQSNHGDEALLALVEETLPGFMGSIHCIGCWMEVPLRIDGDSVDFDVFAVKSSHLARNLRGCSCAILFAATLGMQTELDKKKAALTSPSKALVLDAMGSAAIEVFCDELCDMIRGQYADYLPRPRFSPGYGDFPLEVQQKLMLALDANRRVGISLTDGMLMLPQKSVTAVMGLGTQGCDMDDCDCEDCRKENCGFRR